MAPFAQCALDARRIAAGAAFTAAGVGLVELGLRVEGAFAGVEAGGGRAALWQLASLAADAAVLACVVLFFGAFRHLARQAREECEWMATLLFGLALVAVAVSLLAVALEAAGFAAAAFPGPRRAPALGRLGDRDEAVLSTLASLLFAGVDLLAAAVARASGALPRHAARVALGAGLVTLAAIPLAWARARAPELGWAGWNLSDGSTAWIAWALVAGFDLLGQRRQRR